MKPILVLSLCLVLASAAYAQQSPQPISDNSFFIEEAYNQDYGVVQHINTFTRMRGGDWAYTFTQEWPLFSMQHQISYTFVAQDVDGQKGVGDFTLNYRYQLVNRKRVAIAPRVSLILPTGDSAHGLGGGGVGVQTNLPVSFKLSEHFVTHWNAGATFTPGAKDVFNEKAAAKSANLGASAVWLARPRFNVLTEVIWNSLGTVIGPSRTAQSYTLLVNPGVRWAYNFKKGELQIVPGVSVPIGVGPSRGDRGVLFYLSFEHRFKKPKEPASTSVPNGTDNHF